MQHQDSCPPARIGTWLAEAGASLDVRRPYAGEPLPGDLTDHAGLLVLGGSMGTNDDASVPWLEPTKRLLRVAAGDGVPALGICLGHQLAAVALGGTVQPDGRGRTAGLRRVGWQDAVSDDPLLGPVAADGAVAVQWNRDSVVTLPPGALELARRADGQLQAARFAPTVWGVQWHPEADGDVVATWAAKEQAATGDGGEHPGNPGSHGEVDLDAAVAAVAAHSDRLRRTWRPLAQRLAAACSS